LGVTGNAKTVEYIDGIKVMRLHDSAAHRENAQDLAMLRIWQMLTGGQAMRDASAVNRAF
jgi:hypothetical protein